MSGPGLTWKRAPPHGSGSDVGAAEGEKSFAAPAGRIRATVTPVGVFRSRSGFSVDVDVTAGATIMHARGDVDVETTPRFEGCFHTAVAHHRPSVLITDLSGVDFLSAAGLAALVRRSETFEVTGRFLVIALTVATLRPMYITGLTDMFDVHPSIYAALATI